LNHIATEVKLARRSSSVSMRPATAAASAAKLLLKHCSDPKLYLEAVRYLEILGIFGTLSPISKPEKGDYKEVKSVDSRGVPYSLCVHSRHPYLFSSDNGRTWYLYDTRRQLRKPVKFPFSPEI
jgi:hypothetical protein